MFPGEDGKHVSEARSFLWCHGSKNLSEWVSCFGNLLDFEGKWFCWELFQPVKSELCNMKNPDYDINWSGLADSNNSLIERRINQNYMMWTFSAGSCNSSLISEAHHFRVLSEDQVSGLSYLSLGTAINLLPFCTKTHIPTNIPRNQVLDAVDEIKHRNQKRLVPVWLYACAQVQERFLNMPSETNHWDLCRLTFR